MLQFWHKRTKVCTLAYFSLLESRSVEMPLTMEHSATLDLQAFALAIGKLPAHLDRRWYRYTVIAIVD